SKDALAASACESAFAAAAAKWRRRIAEADSPAAARELIAERYLRSANCDPSVATCPTATLVTDVARTGDDHPIHASYLAGVREQIDPLTGLGASGDREKDRAAACVQLATMMGALLLARATHGDPIADEIVDAAREHLARRRSRRKGGAK